MEKEKIIVAIPVEEEMRQKMLSVCGNYQLEFDADDYSEAVAILGRPDEKKLKDAKKLRWLGSSLAGVDAYIKDGVFPNDNVVVTNATGAFGLAISEHLVGCTFELYKKLHLYRDNQNRNLWADRGNVKRIKDSVVVILGMGDIGSEYGKRMKAMGCRIIGIRRHECEKPQWCDEIYTVEKLDILLPRADILAMALPGNSETANIMNAYRISLMKSDAIILNVGRGNAIDNDALALALQSEKLGGCALDVTNPEPLPPSHPLWNCENAVITPHVSGFYHLRDTYDNIIDILTDNLSRFCRGDALINVVDMKTGYKKK